MHRRSVILAAFLILFIPLSVTYIVSIPTTRTITILHTNDLQSRLLGFGPNAEYSPGTVNNDDTIGGFARLATLIERRRAAAREAGHTVLLLDGGDFSMGTLFHTITRQTGGELRLMHMVGYDAVAIGNHEFDFSPEGLAQMITSARNSEHDLPVLLMSNLRFDPDDAGDDRLQALFNEGVIQPYHIIERDGLRIGLIGLMGYNAWEVTARKGPLRFEDPIETTRRLARELKNEHGVHMVIVCSHGGVSSDDQGRRIGDAWNGEDIELATQVPEVDAIIGGHSHTPIPDPRIVHEHTPVLQAGSEARYLGELVMEVGPESIEYVSYELHPIDDSIPGDARVTAYIEDLKARITRDFLQKWGYRFEQPIAEVHRDLTEAYDDQALGNLIADSIRTAADADIGLTSNGVIRDNLLMGRTGIQSVSDVFRLAPLGEGKYSDAPGYPLMKCYLTASELKSVLEVLSFAYRVKGNSYYPRFSGLRFEFNPWRMPLDNVYKIEIGNPESGYREIDLNDEETLYSVALTTYLGGFVAVLDELSMGLHSVTIKDEQGAAVTDINDLIIDGNPDETGVQEVKEWLAIMNHLRRFSDTNDNGVPDVPDDAAINELRMISAPGLSALFQNAGLTWLYPLLLLILIGVAIFIFRRFKK